MVNDFGVGLNHTAETETGQGITDVHSLGNTSIGQPQPNASTTLPQCLDPSTSAVLGGVDVVAYWTSDERANATYGSADISYGWAGYTWYFASYTNRAAFMKAPEKYAPQWGGFCAFGISDESWWTASTLGPDADPNTWRILNGNLYLFKYCTPEYLFMTHKNLTAEIEKGDHRWQGWFGGTPIYNTACLWSNKGHGGNHTSPDSNQSYGCDQVSSVTRAHVPGHVVR